MLSGAYKSIIFCSWLFQPYIYQREPAVHALRWPVLSRLQHLAVRGTRQVVRHMREQQHTRDRCFGM